MLDLLIYQIKFILARCHLVAPDFVYERLLTIERSNRKLQNGIRKIKTSRRRNGTQRRGKQLPIFSGTSGSKESSPLVRTDCHWMHLFWLWYHLLCLNIRKYLKKVLLRKYKSMLEDKSTKVTIMNRGLLIISDLFIKSICVVL